MRGERARDSDSGTPASDEKVGVCVVRGESAAVVETDLRKKPFDANTALVRRFSAKRIGIGRD